MFYNAFPSYLKDDLNKVLKTIPIKTYNHVSRGVTDETISYKLNDHTVIEIPYRMYFLDIADLEYEKLNATQKELLCCIYTRSCNGYIREKYLKKLLESSFDDWAIPFIVKLCDEYVMEILVTIYSYIKDRDNREIKLFCLENKLQMKKSYSRMISYWNEFYRSQEKNFHQYIGKKLYRECLGYNRSFEKV